ASFPNNRVVLIVHGIPFELFCFKASCPYIRVVCNGVSLYSTIYVCQQKNCTLVCTRPFSHQQRSDTSHSLFVTVLIPLTSCILPNCLNTAASSAEAEQFVYKFYVFYTTSSGSLF